MPTSPTSKHSAYQDEPPAGLAELVSALPEPALLTRDGWTGAGVEIVAANAAFAQLTGYEAAEIIGKNTRLLHGPRTDLAVVTVGRDKSPRLAGETWLHRIEETGTRSGAFVDYHYYGTGDRGVHVAGAQQPVREHEGVARELHGLLMT